MLISRVVAAIIATETLAAVWNTRAWFLVVGGSFIKYIVIYYIIMCSSLPAKTFQTDVFSCTSVHVMYKVRWNGVGEINNRFLAVWRGLENLLCGQHPNKEEVVMKKKTYDNDDVHDGLNKSGPDGAWAAACRRVCGCLLKCFVDGPEWANKSTTAA